MSWLWQPPARCGGQPSVAAEAAPTLVSDPGHEAAAALERFAEGRPVLTKPTSSLTQCGIRPRQSHSKRTDGLQTHRWREPDSNPWSPLIDDGSETILGAWCACVSGRRDQLVRRGDRRFESAFLHRGVRHFTKLEGCRRAPALLRRSSSGP